MQRSIWLKTLLISLFGLFSLATLASDTAKEKRWADQVVDSVMVGDAEWLAVGNSKILSLYTEYATEKARGAAIVLHGVGVHPNWDQIVRPVRSQLPEYGWSTLSVQMPILANDAKYSEYVPLFSEIAPRLDAAVNFLKNKGINNIVIVAHSLGATMGAYYVSRTPGKKDIQALVAIGSTGASFKDPEKNYFKSLETIKIPVMDIFGAIDLPEVMQGAEKKRTLARKYGIKYTQIKVEGANHFFAGKEDELVKRVRGWLKTNAPGK